MDYEEIKITGGRGIDKSTYHNYSFLLVVVKRKLQILKSSCK